MKEDTKEAIWLWCLVFFGSLSIALGVVMYLLKKYWYVWVVFALCAVAWVHFITIPDQIKALEKPQPVQEEQWSCHTWEESVTFNGLEASLERCWLNDSERYRLYVGNEVLIEEKYEHGIFISQSINTDLLNRLMKSQKETLKTRTFREDI